MQKALPPRSRLLGHRRFDALRDRRFLIVARVGAALVISVLFMAAFLALTGLRVNLTTSLPPGLYYIRPLAVYERFTIVSACLPEAQARLGRERGYLLPGSCASGVVPILKIIVAIPGDSVRLDSAGLHVDGRLIAGCGQQHGADDQGKKLSALRGSWRLTDAVFLCGLSEDSWDSRYFGPVPLSALQGGAHWKWAQARGWQRLEMWRQLFIGSVY